MIDQRENICHGLFVLANDKPSRGDSCPGEGTQAAVRCCSDDDTNCEAPDAPLCSKTVTYYWAEQKCADSGRRLCHPSELRTNMCCKPGCGSDIPSDFLVWANKAKSMYI